MHIEINWAFVFAAFFISMLLPVEDTPWTKPRTQLLYILWHWFAVYMILELFLRGFRNG